MYMYTFFILNEALWDLWTYILGCISIIKHSSMFTTDPSCMHDYEELHMFVADYAWLSVNAQSRSAPISVYWDTEKKVADKRRQIKYTCMYNKHTRKDTKLDQTMCIGINC